MQATKFSHGSRLISLLDANNNESENPDGNLISKETRKQQFFDCDTAIAPNSNMVSNEFQSMAQKRKRDENMLRMESDVSLSQVNGVSKYDPERALICDVPSCNFLAKNSSQLDDHTNAIHTQKISYCCAMKGCGMVTFSSSVYKLHLNRHKVLGQDCHKSPSLKCPHFRCRFWTHSQHFLDQHVSEIHTGKLKYLIVKDSSCKYIAHSVQALVTHWRKYHKMNKTYMSCPYFGCSFSTSSKVSLSDHINTSHSILKIEYPCDFECEAIFFTKAALKAHIWKHHVGSMDADRNQPVTNQDSHTYAAPSCSDLCYDADSDDELNSLHPDAIICDLYTVEYSKSQSHT